MIRSSGTMNILVKERMTYTLPLSLKRIAIVKIATTLWNKSISAFNTGYYCKEIEEKVIEKVLQLALPETLKKEILGCVIPIGLRIFRWIEYQLNYLDDDGAYIVKNLSKLCWTPQGIVDDKKTAEAIIKDENLDIEERYKLACVYCLEDDVRELWGSMPQRKKSIFNNELCAKDDLISIWTCYIQFKGEVSSYQLAFEFAALYHNKAATEFFLQKLTPIERKESLVKYVTCIGTSGSRFIYGHFYGHHNSADLLCFLLSQMNEEQQAKVFNSYSHHLLKWLLDWPWQHFFIETANRVWYFLSKFEYDAILFLIVKKVREGHKDCDYQKLFGEFWQQSPNPHKRYVIDQCCYNARLLQYLLNFEDKENISLILKTATLTEKEKIIFGFTGEEICNDLVSRNKWDLLKFFICECIASQETMIKFKEEFKNQIRYRLSIDKCDRFVQLLDDLIHGYDKRKSIEEVGGNSAKRLCSIEFEEVIQRKEVGKCSSLNQ